MNSFRCCSGTVGHVGCCFPRCLEAPDINFFLRSVSEIFSALALNKKCSVSRVTASAELKTRYKFSVTRHTLWTPGRNGTVPGWLQRTDILGLPSVPVIVRAISAFHPVSSVIALRHYSVGCQIRLWKLRVPYEMGTRSFHPRFIGPMSVIDGFFELVRT